MKISKRIFKLIYILTIVLIVGIVIYKLFLSFFVGGLLLTEDKFKQEKIYNSVSQCISEKLNSTTYNPQISDPKSHEYGKSIYLLETDNIYIEIFSETDEYELWLFVIDKVDIDGEMKYQINHCENCLQLSRDEWKSTPEFDFIITQNIENYSDITETKITKELQLKTKQGYETLYIIIDNEECLS